MVNLPAHWRAACVILADAFARDDDVWAHVTPGETADLHTLIADTSRPDADRTLLACAQSLADGDTGVPLPALVALSGRRLTLVLDALAIARGGFPTID